MYHHQTDANINYTGYVYDELNKRICKFVSVYKSKQSTIANINRCIAEQSYIEPDKTQVYCFSASSNDGENFEELAEFAAVDASSIYEEWLDATIYIIEPPRDRLAELARDYGMRKQEVKTWFEQYCNSQELETEEALNGFAEFMAKMFESVTLEALRKIPKCALDVMRAALAEGIQCRWSGWCLWTNAGFEFAQKLLALGFEFAQKRGAWYYRVFSK